MTAPLHARVPPALAALDAYPLLRSAIKPSLARQVARIAASVAKFSGRQALLEELRYLFQTTDRGLITLEGPAGSGVTSLLAYLALTYPAAFWFADDAEGQGAATLYAQLVALYRPTVALVAPAVERDPLALEQLLVEIAPQRSADAPLVILLDPPASVHQPRDRVPLPLPLYLPPHVIVVCGCMPSTRLPWTPKARVKLPLDGDELLHEQSALLRQQGCPLPWIEPLISAAQGNYLYLRLAQRMGEQDGLTPTDLPAGLDGLFAAWWTRLNPAERRLALLLAASAEPVSLSLCAQLLDCDPLPILEQWTERGLVTMQRRERESSDETPVSVFDTQFAAFDHWTISDYLARHEATALAQIHTELAQMTLGLGNDPSGVIADQLMQRFARHAALGTETTRNGALPLVAQRNWIVGQERRNGHLRQAAQDIVWELEQAAQIKPEAKQGPEQTTALLRLVRSAALAGTLASRARTLAADVAVGALEKALELRGRESGLKRVLDIVEQLPDGRDKALVLRQMGEACYGLRLRTQAMRLLSRALDLEEAGFPRSWREQREQLHAALASAALSLGDVDAALAISGRIGHTERRGMAETQVVRWLLAQGATGDRAAMSRAQEVARAISHESMGAWARAEVAIALARAGEQAAAEALLDTIAIETASAWAEIELACDSAASDEDAARARINRLSSPNQRDRGLARLAHALALAAKDGDALAAAEQIGDVEVRVSALLNLRLTLEGLVAMLALEQATAEIGALTGNARVPLLASLAAAHAALGRRDRALGIAQQLAEGEERDRALSRVAVAFTQHGDYAQAQATARELEDDDERDWAFDELSRIMAAAERWTEAERMAQEIKADDQRGRTLAELAIARARASDALAGLQLALSIAIPSERARALTIIAPLLVNAGMTTAALAVASVGAEDPLQSNIFVSFDARGRYIAAVAGALAEQGELAQAQALTNAQIRPIDQARIQLAIARSTAPHDPQQAYAALGAALRTTLLGRDEAFRVLEQATTVLVTLGGAPLLLGVAATLDEIDSW